MNFAIGIVGQEKTMPRNFSILVDVLLGLSYLNAKQTNVLFDITIVTYNYVICGNI